MRGIFVLKGFIRLFLLFSIETEGFLVICCIIKLLSRYIRFTYLHLFAELIVKM